MGSGEEATAGRVATIEFEGTLLDGVKVLSSTRKDGKPLSFTVEAGDAPLWDEVVVSCAHAAVAVQPTCRARALRRAVRAHPPRV